MAHIHTNPGEHDHTVSAFIIRTDFEEPKLMLHLHKKLGVLLQFGGHIEVEESPWETLTHEILEESGYGIEQLRILQPRNRLKGVSGCTIHPLPAVYQTHEFKDIGHFHTDGDYAFVTDQEPNHPVGQGESDEFMLVTQAELAALPTEKIFPNVKEIGAYMLDVILSDWEEVPTSEFK